MPTMLHTDNAKEFLEGRWKQVRTHYGGVKQTFTEPYSPWQNRAKASIREHKKQVQQIFQRTKASRRLWDFLVVYVAEIRSRTAHPSFDLHGRTPYKVITGNTPDITEWLEYEWYQPIWYLDPGAFPGDPLKIGRWLGVAH